VSDLTRQQERIVRNAQRAGLRMSLREGHVPTKEEILKVKVQVAPPWARLVSGGLGVASGFGSWYCFTSQLQGWGFGQALLAILLLCFAAFGIRRTLSAILDSLDAVQAAELLGYILEGIFSAVGSLFD
jgi:hypothetical protein